MMYIPKFIIDGQLLTITHRGIHTKVCLGILFKVLLNDTPLSFYRRGSRYLAVIPLNTKLEDLIYRGLDA